MVAQSDQKGHGFETQSGRFGASPEATVWSRFSSVELLQLVVYFSIYSFIPYLYRIFIFQALRNTGRLALDAANDEENNSTSVLTSLRKVSQDTVTGSTLLDLPLECVNGFLTRSLSTVNIWQAKICQDLILMNMNKDLEGTCFFTQLRFI